MEKSNTLERKKLVVIESPYAGGFFQRLGNVRYARKCLLDSLKRGEAPIASHLLYTQVLDDGLALERKLGIESGLSWMEKCDMVAIYVGRGISKGMLGALREAYRLGKPIEYRV